MSVKIRLLRMGKKKKPFYRMVVVDSRKSCQSGNYLEKVGDYDPMSKESTINSELVKGWIAKGAQPSDRVKKILETEKVI